MRTSLAVCNAPVPTVSLARASARRIRLALRDRMSFGINVEMSIEPTSGRIDLMPNDRS
ncbi:MAG TPA: hypothetical protein VL383_16615 [Gemmatimonadaceae bacterium]|nr:hypothetical protein [Gemmatimonadaceae bacterium]